VKVQPLHPEAKLPKYAYPGDSGFDLASTEKMTLLPGETHLVPTGLAFAIPEGFELQIRPRSGLSLKTNIRIPNSPGTVDSGFRTEVKVIIQNVGNTPLEIDAGMRIAQGIICPVIHPTIEYVYKLDKTERGLKGFGSSGTN
jgi:dUTP pyrophosphatase